MTGPKISTISERFLAEYFSRSLYCFLPNMCNARCDFCYVRPTFAEHSSLPEPSLIRLEATLKFLRELGFQDVRLTGGEPLILRNLSHIVDMLRNLGMSYTVLTNGLRLPDHVDLFSSRQPSKITVSMHALDNPGQIFGRDWASDKTIEAIKTLSRRNVPIALTIVFESSRAKQAEVLVKAATEWGVREFRIIASNTADWTSQSWRDMRGTVARIKSAVDLRNVKIRSTDPRANSCELLHRGRLSLALPQFDLYGCCVQVGDSSKIAVWDKQPQSLLKAMRAIYLENRSLTEFGCSTYIGTCPISKMTHHGSFPITAMP